MAQHTVGQAVKEQLLRDMDAGFAKLMDRAGSIESLRSSGGGPWGRFEVLSHIAGWHGSAAGRLRQIARGEEPSAPPPADEINDAFVADRAALSRDELMQQLRDSFALLRNAVEQVDAAEFWLGGPGEENSLAHFIASENSHGHYEEHAEDLGQ